LWLYAWQLSARSERGEPLADGSTTLPTAEDGDLLDFGVRRTYEIPGGAYAPTAARLALEATAPPVDSSMLFTLRLLVSELVTNSVLHGGAGEHDSIELVVLLAGAGVRVEVCNSGAGFEPASPGNDGEADGGRGLRLVDAFADRWGVIGDRGTRVWFELDRLPVAEEGAMA
jgi:anti-sigma regulatory factor (Ser/Thr protein kinase)